MYTVSGVSSGGYMATQIHIAASSLFTGAALYASGPYMCALNSLYIAETMCTSMVYQNTKPNLYSLIDVTAEYSEIGAIDPITNLKDDIVYIYSGVYDTVIRQPIVQVTQEYYQHYVAERGIFTEYAVKSEHCLPTIAYGNPCNTLGSPYLSACMYAGAYEGLKHLYPGLREGQQQYVSNLVEFDQTRYFDSFTAAKSSLSPVGYYYNGCITNATGTCNIHVSFHGCKQGRQFIGDEYARNAGFNEIAEANQMVILYPYVDTSVLNPDGCWDWWGYTGYNYAHKSGAQIQAVLRMLADPPFVIP